MEHHRTVGFLAGMRGNHAAVITNSSRNAIETRGGKPGNRPTKAISDDTDVAGRLQRRNSCGYVGKHVLDQNGLADRKDESRNITPVVIWLGGEELHNNHHADPHSARFSQKWFEFDVGWLYLRLLSLFGLAKIQYARKSPK
jgi:hypothetical protein